MLHPPSKKSRVDRIVSNASAIIAAKLGRRMKKFMAVEKKKQQQP
jgi:hypothetical protein